MADLKKGGGIYIERELFLSDAFLSLSRNGIKMLMALLDDRDQNKAFKKLQKKGVSAPRFLNLDQLKAPYVKLRDQYLMNDSGISAAKDELLAKGFISITNEGGLGKHDQATYALIDDYKRWKPGAIFRTRKKDVRRGYQGRLLGATDPGKNKSRSGNLRLTHAIKPETNDSVSLRKPETIGNMKLGAA